MGILTGQKLFSKIRGDPETKNPTKNPEKAPAIREPQCLVELWSIRDPRDSVLAFFAKI